MSSRHTVCASLCCAQGLCRQSFKLRAGFKPGIDSMILNVPAADVARQAYYALMANDAHSCRASASKSWLCYFVCSRAKLSLLRSAVYSLAAAEVPGGLWQPPAISQVSGLCIRGSVTGPVDGPRLQPAIFDAIACRNIARCPSHQPELRQRSRYQAIRFSVLSNSTTLLLSNGTGSADFNFAASRRITRQRPKLATQQATPVATSSTGTSLK